MTRHIKRQVQHTDRTFAHSFKHRGHRQDNTLKHHIETSHRNHIHITYNIKHLEQFLGALLEGLERNNWGNGEFGIIVFYYRKGILNVWIRKGNFE